MRIYEFTLRPLCSINANRPYSATKEILPCTGIRLWIANGASAGQEIFHLHVHVFPCKSVIDRIKYVFPSLTGKQTMTDADLAEMANPIRLKIMEISRSEDRPIS